MQMIEALDRGVHAIMPTALHSIYVRIYQLHTSGQRQAARDLFDRLYSHGVLVRDVSAYPLLERCLRVSIGTPEENDKFLAALDRALEDK